MQPFQTTRRDRVLSRETRWFFFASHGSLALSNSGVFAAARRMLSLTSTLVLVNSTQAQEALRSALSLDRTLEQRSEDRLVLRPAGPHLGPLALTLGLYERTSYDDNVNLSQADTKSDTTVSVGIHLGVDGSVTETSALHFGTSVGYAHYLEGTRNGGLEVQPDSALTYQISLAEITLTLFDQLSYSRQVITEGALANLGTLPRMENTVGARISWAPGRWHLEQGYSHNSYSSDRSAFNYLNRSSEYLFLRAGWSLAESTQIGIESSGTSTSYQVAVENNNYNISVGPYAEWQIGSSVRLSLRGGPTFTVFDSNPSSSSNSTLDSYFLGFDGTHQLTEFVTHRLNLVRDVQAGLNQGSAYIEQLRVGYSVTWAMTPWVNLGASVAWETGRQPLAVALPGNLMAQAQEKFDRYTVGPQLSWQATDHFTLSLSYTLGVRHSSLAARDYRSHSMSLQLSYGF